jgi:hypothetical protein
MRRLGARQAGQAPMLMLLPAKARAKGSFISFKFGSFPTRPQVDIIYLVLLYPT